MQKVRRLTNASILVLAVLGWVGGTPAAAQHESSDVAAVVKSGVPPVVAPEIGAPANDNCAAPVVIASLPFNHVEDTTGATTEPGEPVATCTTDGASVWFEYTHLGANSAVATAETFGSGYDTVLEAFTGACGGLSSISCNDDSGAGLQSAISFIVDPGVTYRIKAAGFQGAVGNLVFDFDVVGGACPAIEISGTLGSGSPDWPSVSGTQLGRLNRNGIQSTCAAPKACLLFTGTGDRAFDAYTIPNDSGAPQCVTAFLDVITQTACNLQVNAYLDVFDPTNICTNYLADPGLSSGVPPSPTSMSFVVPTGQSMVLAVHTTNPGEIGCLYDLTVLGDVCAPCALVEPADIVVGTDPGACGAVVNYPPPSTTGACTGIITCDPPSGSFFAPGTTTVTCTETGGASTSFDITVNDTEAPTITCPADIEQDLPPGEVEGPVDWADLVVGDNCPVNPAVCVPPSGSIFPGGETTAVNCAVTDGAGTVATCAFNVTLNIVSILEIPTLSPAGIAVLLLAFSSAGFFLLRRRRSAR